MSLESLYRKVLLVRLCEQQIMSEYFQDEMKTPVHLGIGQEAIACGVQDALPKHSKFFGTYRNHGIYLACSEDTDGFFGEMYGKSNGCGKGKAGSMHMANPEHGLLLTSAVVGTTIPVAVGAALAAKMTGDKKPVCVFFGDGAVEEGVFYESMNFASLRQLPVLFVCEDNDLAIHTKRHDRHGFKSFADIVAAFDCEFESADGVDAEVVKTTTETILSKMAKSGRPGFLHFRYFRFLEHVGPMEDFDKGYREKPRNLVEEFDPVLRLESNLKKAGATDETLLKIRGEIQNKINKSVAAAKAAPFPSPDELFADVLSETRGSC